MIESIDTPISTAVTIPGGSGQERLQTSLVRNWLRELPARKGLVAICRWQIVRFGNLQPAPPTVHRTVGFYFSSPFPAIKNPDTRWVSGFFGTPEGTRTPDLLIRSQSLYPTELLAHTPHRRLSIIAQPVQKSKLFFRVPGNSSEADQTVFTGPFGCDMIIQKPADAGHGTG